MRFLSGITLFFFISGSVYSNVDSSILITNLGLLFCRNLRNIDDYINYVAYDSIDESGISAFLELFERTAILLDGGGRSQAQGIRTIMRGRDQLSLLHFRIRGNSNNYYSVQCLYYNYGARSTDIDRCKFFNAHGSELSIRSVALDFQCQSGQQAPIFREESENQFFFQPTIVGTERRRTEQAEGGDRLTPEAIRSLRLQTTGGDSHKFSGSGGKLEE